MQRSRRARTFIIRRKALSRALPLLRRPIVDKDYPRYNFESRVLLWFANQQHLYYGSFVLAVPIFCMVIEFMGVVTKDKALAKRYDQLAYDFIKISLTAYSLTAILGGILIFTFLTLYPAFFQLSLQYL